MSTLSQRSLREDAAGDIGSTRMQSRAVYVFGALVALAIVLICFFSPRRPGMEEVGVFNAVYTYAHFGKMTFPIYGLDFFNSFGIHPHLHYAILAWLLRLGLGLYSAEATVISIVSLITIALILHGKFPDPVKLGFLLGLYGAVVLSVLYLPDHAAGVRPELHVSIAWFAGLVALESGRLDNWRLSKLFFGALLVTYAAAMQNYALLAPAGVGVYAVWMLCAMPARQSMKRIVACTCAIAVIAVPFVILYAYPNWQMMRANMNWSATHSAPVGAKLAAYFDVYDGQVVPLYRNDLFSSLFAIGPLLGVLLLKIPPFLATAALFAILPATRGMALAFLPVPVLAMWTLPKTHYFISEELIYLSAFWSAALSGCYLLGKVAPRVKRAVPVILPMACGALLLLGSPQLRDIHPLKGLPLHEMEVARAAARQIVGPNALVASRHLGWYISGGINWYRVEASLTEPAKLERFDPKLFASQFDAVADYPVFSWQTQNGNSSATMYLAGALQLKGFYLAQRMGGLSLLIFQGSRSGHVVGYCMRDDRLQRFDEDHSGPVAFVTALGPRDHAADVFGSLIYEPNILDIPGNPLTTAISAYVVSRATYFEKAAALPAEFKILETTFGRLSPVDAHALVRASQATDRTINFLRTPQQTTLTTFLARADHPIALPDACTGTDLHPADPVAPVSSGSLAPAFEPQNVFDDKPSTWASERLGPTTMLVSFIGADFGPNQPVEVRAIGLQHSPDPGSSISSAILMSSDTSYNWSPIAVLQLNKDGALHTYCLPPSGGHRFWKLVAGDNPKHNYAWQIATLRFYR
jgi:hypothetical protein